VQTAGEREGEMGGAEAGRQEAERVGKEERSRGDKGARGVWGVKGAQGGSVRSVSSLIQGQAGGLVARSIFLSHRDTSPTYKG
jgi:hypothetical protein